MRCSLALLLSLNDLCLDAENRCSTGSLSTSQETRLGEDVGEVAIKGATATRREDGVGMVDVGSREILYTRLKGGESDDDLWKEFCD